MQELAATTASMEEIASQAAKKQNELLAELERLRDELTASRAGGEEQTSALRAEIERLKAEAAAAAKQAEESLAAAQQ